VIDMPRPEPMLTTTEAAAAVNVHRKTLSKYVADGLIKPTLRLPTGHMRWELDDLKRQLRELDARRTGGDQEGDG
jgi:predicted site-specific integrase-resolvase